MVIVLKRKSRQAKPWEPQPISLGTVLQALAPAQPGTEILQWGPQSHGKGMPSGSGIRMLQWEGAKVPGSDFCSCLQPAVTLTAVLAGHASMARKSP